MKSEDAIFRAGWRAKDFTYIHMIIHSTVLGAY